MKKIFTIGLLALAISFSANAKSAKSVNHATKRIHLSKEKKVKLIPSVILTTCGEVFAFENTGLTDDQFIWLLDFINYALCGESAF